MPSLFSLSAPTLILGVGISGSGKSTLLHEVARRVNNSVYIEKDLINYAFLKTANAGERSDITRYRMEGPPVPRDDPANMFYRDHVMLQTYDCMLQMARQNLEFGKHPILEGNYVKELRWGYIEQVLTPALQGVAYRLKIVLTHAPEEVVRKRVVERAAAHDTQKVMSDTEWARMLAEQPPIPPEIEQYPHFKVDTSIPAKHETFSSLMRFLLE